jgi:hypothetical protein
MRKIIEKIIDGCSEVKKNPEIHKDAKDLATLVIKDCNDALKKEWVGLTKEEARKICVATVPYVVDMAAAIEARLKEKNDR